MTDPARPTHVIPVTIVDRPHPDSPENDNPASGTELGWGELPPSDWRYERYGVVGRGGMATVIRARDRLLGRTVALKVVSDPRHRRRFRREAHIHAHLLHPAIPPLFDAGRFADGQCFLAIRYVRGLSLSQLATAPPADPAELRRRLGWFEQVCQAVAYAHGKNILHRDLKPSNVLVGSHDRAFLIDWGLAKVKGTSDAGFEDDLTADGATLGTLGFMPPELVERGVARADERADLFGPGGVLCGLLTGQAVYTGPLDDVTRAARDGDTTAAVERVAASGVPGGLVEMVRRCLARRPADRPATVAEVTRAVAAVRSAASQHRVQAPAT